MAGFTIIHLSDLHIAEKASYSRSFDDLADFTAKSLADDFQKVAERHSIIPRPEETLLVITGDITSKAKWEHYENAIYFIGKLRDHLNECMEGGEFPYEHIICLPGNHDIEIPEEVVDDAATLRKTKYRNFKLFFEEITNYSSFARNFTLTDPFVNVQLSVPFNFQILDLNSTLNINSFSRENSDSKASFSIEQKLTLNTFLKKQNDSFRIALMHHQLDDFPPQDVEDKLSRRTLRDWLINNRFKIVLCGHAHLATDEQVKPVFKKVNGLLVLGTGPSFLVGRASGEGNHYQILRIEPSKNNLILVVKRKYMYGRDNPNLLDQDTGDWKSDGEPARPEISGMSDIIGASDFRNFIGIKSKQDWAVVTHCESTKFQNFGILSPGEQVNANLLKISGYSEGKLEVVNEVSDLEWNKFSAKSAIFLIDSPHYNPYVRSILEKYSTYLAGGAVKFSDLRTERPVIQQIQVHQKTFIANKRDEMKLFDDFVDYLLIMRLPNFIPATGDSDVEIPEDRVIWVVAGIHSKASYAGAMIFTPRNLQLLTASLRKKCGGELPEYFEAVFMTPIEPKRIENFNDLILVHLNVLRLKNEIAMADDLPSGVAVRFLSNDERKTIPIYTVHFDPVAACNFNCPKCIESNVKNKKRFLSMSACTRIICDLKENGCQNLNFYGGEPTLHPNFDSILRLASQLGFDILLVTNGSRLGEERIAKAIIDGRNRIHVRVSIDAASAESHKLHHGLTDNRFENIISSTEKLIRNDVSISISFLLHKGSVGEIEEACKSWKEKRASAFILRPITKKCGKSPELGYNQNEKKMMKAVIENYKGFVFAPTWFQNWLNGDKKFQVQREECEECYSSYYRFAISPYNSTDEPRIRTVDNIEMVEVDNAWISLCTYQRYNPKYGLEYPQDLKEWCKDDRLAAVKRIKPLRQCKNIICCRRDYNRQIENMISSK